MSFTRFRSRKGKSRERNREGTTRRRLRATRVQVFSAAALFPELNHIPAELSQHIAQVMGLG